MTLVEFLTARIERDEMVAKWSMDTDAALWPAIASTNLGALPNFDVSMATLEHLGAHNPHRVLADCAAKRRLIDAFARSVDVMDRVAPIEELEYVGAKTLSILSRFGLQLLALPYADHEDYQQEWAI